MTAVGRHAGFLTRTELKLRRPRSISRNVRPDRGGVALHYGGVDVPISSHAQCSATWRSWQRYHMDTRGWVDIAYTLGVCQHGWVFSGRGYGIRTAANGTNDGNLRFLAIVWIGGGRQTPTDLALAAIDWAIAELRRLGAGDRVVRHSDLNSTGCPGDPLGRHARLRDRQPISQHDQEDDMPTLDEIRALVVAEERVTRNMVTQARDRTNEAIRVGQAVLEDAFRRERHQLGLKPDPSADRDAAQAIRTGRKQYHDVLTAMRDEAHR